LVDLVDEGRGQEVQEEGVEVDRDRDQGLQAEGQDHQVVWDDPGFRQEELRGQWEQEAELDRPAGREDLGLQLGVLEVYCLHSDLGEECFLRMTG
jgi:hypothetical protein